MVSCGCSPTCQIRKFWVSESLPFPPPQSGTYVYFYLFILPQINKISRYHDRHGPSMPLGDNIGRPKSRPPEWSGKMTLSVSSEISQRPLNSKEAGGEVFLFLVILHSRSTSWWNLRRHRPPRSWILVTQSLITHWVRYVLTKVPIITVQFPGSWWCIFRHFFTVGKDIRSTSVLAILGFSWRLREVYCRRTKSI